MVLFEQAMSLKDRVHTSGAFLRSREVSRFDHSSLNVLLLRIVSVPERVGEAVFDVSVADGEPFDRARAVSSESVHRDAVYPEDHL